MPILPEIIYNTLNMLYLSGSEASYIQHLRAAYLPSFPAQQIISADTKEISDLYQHIYISSEDANAHRRTYRKKLRERQLPGVSPLVYSRFLLENAVFLSLSDMGKELPEYEEIPIELKGVVSCRETKCSL